jgi:hypothetical protein
MSLHTLSRRALALALLIPALASSALAQTSAEVTFVSPNYIATKNVNGAITQVYSGTEYYTAVNTAITSLTANRTVKERVTVRAGGSSGNTPVGVIKAINLRSNTIIDFQNNTVFVNPVSALNATGQAVDDAFRFGVGIKADRADNIEILNVRVTGWPRYGFWITGCNNVRLSGVSMAFSIDTAKGVIANGIGVRADNNTRSTTAYATGFRHEGTSTFTGMTGNPGNNHGFETNLLDGAQIGNITSTDVGSCSLLLNRTRNTDVGIVTGVRCDTTGSYAAFRCANDAGPGVITTKVISRDCGRGFFTPTRCFDITVLAVDLRTSVSEGILLQTGGSSTVGTIGVASYIMDGLKEGIRNDDAHTGSTFNQIALRRNARGGIWETDGAGSNAYVNVDARNGVGTNTRLGPGSTFTGGFR